MLLSLFSALQIFAAPANTACAGKSFFGIPTWYKYLYDAGRIDQTSAGVCELKRPFKPETDFALVGLSLLDILLRVAGLVAVGYIIYGGIQYVLSEGSPDKAKKAQETIINALIGLAIAIVATAVVAFIGAEVAK